MFEELVKAESLSEQIEPQWQREPIYIYSVTTFRQTWRGISIEITQNTGRMRNLILILRKTRPALPSALWNAVDWASNVLWFKRKNCLKREKWRVNNSFHLSSICPCFVSRFSETFSYALTKYKLWYRLQVDTACWLVAVCPCSEVQSSPAVPISNRVGLSTFCNTLFYTNTWRSVSLTVEAEAKRPQLWVSLIVKVSSFLFLLLFSKDRWVSSRRLGCVSDWIQHFSGSTRGGERRRGHPPYWLRPVEENRWTPP